MQVIKYDLSTPNVVVFNFGHDLIRGSGNERLFVRSQFVNKRHPRDSAYGGLPGYMRRVIDDLFRFSDIDEVVRAVHIQRGRVELTLASPPRGLDIDPVGWFHTLYSRATHKSAKFVLARPDAA